MTIATTRQTLVNEISARMVNTELAGTGSGLTGRVQNALRAGRSVTVTPVEVTGPLQPTEPQPVPPPHVKAIPRRP